MTRRKKRKSNPPTQLAHSKPTQPAEAEVLGSEPASRPIIPGAFQISQEFYSGPIPDPTTLERYEHIAPGSANIIVSQFVEQSAHRIHLEKTVIEGDNKRAFRGQWMAFCIGLAGLTVGCIGLFTGHAYEGSIIATATLGGLAASFLYGTKSRREERERKAEHRDPSSPPEKQ
jgi:uncharacterized membrane protein